MHYVFSVQCVLNRQGYFFWNIFELFCFLLLLLLAVVIIVDVYVLFHVSVTNRFWASKYAGQRCKMIGVFLEHTKQKLLIEFKRPALKSVFIIFEAFKSNVLKNESQKKNRIIGLFLGCREKERAHTKS